MYEVEVTRAFPAKHQLTYADRHTEPMHEHQWTIRVLCEAPDIDGTGMGIDFVKLDGKVESVVSPLRNRVLNETPPFAGQNPTAENMARYVFQALAQDPELCRRVRVKKVWVSEAEGYRASYSEGA